MEIVKYRRINRIIFIICLSILIFYSCAFAQNMGIERSFDYNDYYNKSVVTKYPSYTLAIVDKSDTTYLSILSDSISQTSLAVRIYAYHHKKFNIDRRYIKIGFEDGSEYYLRAFDIDKSLRYAEYVIPQDVFIKMYSLKITKAWFNDFPEKIEDSGYFMSFLIKHNR